MRIEGDLGGTGWELLKLLGVENRVPSSRPHS
jgi:hypothetical protein